MANTFLKGETGPDTAAAREIMDIRGIDVPAGLERLGLSFSVFRNLLTDFVRNQQDLVATLGQAVQAADLDKIRRLSHSLAGAAGNLSAHKLAPAARLLERAAGQGEIGQLASLYHALADAFTEVKAGVAELPDQATDQGQLPRDPAPPDSTEIGPLLANLEKSLADFDPINAEKALHILSDRNWPPDRQPLIDDLKTQVESLDYDQARNTVSELRLKLNI